VIRVGDGKVVQGWAPETNLALGKAAPAPAAQVSNTSSTGTANTSSENQPSTSSSTRAAAVAATTATVTKLPAIPPAMSFSTNNIVKVNAEGAGVNLRLAAQAGGTSLQKLKANEKVQILDAPTYNAVDQHWFYKVQVLSTGRTGYLAAGEGSTAWLSR
jgi:hypothetical protein